MKIFKRVLKAVLYFHLIVVPLSLASAYYLLKVMPDRVFEEKQHEGPYDAAIVPGIPYNGDTISDLMKARVLWACYLYEKKLVKNIIFSGSAVYTPYLESKVMAKYAKALGVKEENIFTEERAEHSTENVYYSYRIAKRNGFEKVILATDPFQSIFMSLFIKEIDMPVETLPIVFRILKESNYEMPKIDASDALKEDFVALPERETWLQRMSGTLGWRIKE